jgi:hypothetical protein
MLHGVFGLADLLAGIVPALGQAPPGGPFHPLVPGDATAPPGEIRERPLPPGSQGPQDKSSEDASPRELLGHDT